MAILSYINVQQLNSPPFRIKQNGSKLLGFEGSPEDARLWRVLSESIGQPELNQKWVNEYCADHLPNESADTFIEFTFDLDKGEMFATEYKKEKFKNAGKQGSSLRLTVPKAVRCEKRTKAGNRKG